MLTADVLTIPGLLASQILIIVITMAEVFGYVGRATQAAPRHIGGLGHRPRRPQVIPDVGRGSSHFGQRSPGVAIRAESNVRHGSFDERFRVILVSLNASGPQRLSPAGGVHIRTADG
jgi:hypothetical protein